MAIERGGTLTRDFRIVELLEFIEAGAVVLPEFQRDFDWADDRVAQLLASVIRRWPAGSLLLQEFPGETFYKLRAFDGGPPVDKQEVEYAVLDGQQRLTALYQAIYDSGDFVYAVRAKAIRPAASIEQLEDSVRSFSRSEWDGEHRERPWDKDNDWIPFYALKSPADFFAWRDEATAFVPPDERVATSQELADAYRFGLEAFHTYTLPAVIVDKRLEPEAIARIFERVNRGGLRLSAFDLMVAKTFEPGWNLRERWSGAQAEYPILADFLGDDGMPVIRMISLKANGSVREGDVLRLTGMAVRLDFEPAVRAVAEALQFMKDHCGVWRSEWMPYDGMVTTLAAIAFEHSLEDRASVVVAWFFSRAYGLRYDAGANTVTVEEYAHLRDVFSGAVPLRPITASRKVLSEATKKRRSALWRTFLATLATRGARDFLTGEEASSGAVAMATQAIQHDPPPGTESPHLLVLNQALVSPGTARRLGARGVTATYSQIAQLGDLANEVLKSQLLPAGAPKPERLIEARFQELQRYLATRASDFIDWQ